MLEELKRRARRPKPRRPTKPTRTAVEKRLAGKRLEAEKKRGRGRSAAAEE